VSKENIKEEINLQKHYQKKGFKNGQFDAK